MKNFFTLSLILRVGLACVFFVNSYSAFVDPSEFIDLISGSFVAGLLPVSVASFITLVGFNDLIVGLLLLSGWRLTLVATYATLWVSGVTLVIGYATLDGIEHLGYIASALVLAIRKRLPMG